MVTRPELNDCQSPSYPEAKEAFDTTSSLERFSHTVVTMNVVFAGARELDLVDDLFEEPLPSLFQPVPRSDLKDEQKCPICYSTFCEPDEDGAVEEPVKSSCNHIIGFRCFRQWVIEEECENCPLCRTGFSRATHNFPRRTPAWLKLIRGL